MASLRRFLGGGGQKKLVFRSVGTSQAQPIEPQNAFEVSKQHLDLLSLASRSCIRVGQRQIAGEVPRTLMNGPRHLAGGLSRTAMRLERAAVAVLLAGAVADEPILVDTRAWRREVAVRPLQLLAAGTGISVVLVVVGEIGPGKGAVGPGGLIDYRDMRLDAALVHRRREVLSRP